MVKLHYRVRDQYPQILNCPWVLLPIDTTLCGATPFRANVSWCSDDVPAAIIGYWASRPASSSSFMGHLQDTIKPKRRVNINERRHIPGGAADSKCIGSLFHLYLPISGWTRPCLRLGFKRNVASEYDLPVTASTNTSESCHNNGIFVWRDVRSGGNRADR